MQRLIPLLCLGVASLGMSSCGQAPSGLDKANDNARDSLSQLERRLNQMEQELQELKPASSGSDSKTPAGPLKSLTLRIGTQDDRLRLYWADGQTSNLICSQEGKGVWACG